ncbi:DNA primase [Anaerorhabdus sp.]|uniref:DNA primase n=1 Tax=Anaerorhabdus sp. TaxID=1872524 RepID=UPI002FCCB52F
MRLNDEDILKVRSSADIADIIGRFIPLVKKGKSFTAVCPFHDDHDPSLSISQDKQIYKCFVCGAGGNVFTFVQDYEHITFPEAVIKVADLIGQPLQVSVNDFVKQVDPHKEAGFKVMNEAIQYMMYTLNSASGSTAKEYLHKRGLDEKMIQLFQIGYNDESDNLTKFLKAKGYKDSDCIATNVTKITESGIHDVFTSRITFPIHDVDGNPIGFSARTMDPNNPSKYINTTETEFYVKGNTVYNYHRAKNDARKMGYILVVEGVTDVIAFARAGITNVCATLGTACTTNQLKQLKQCSSTIRFCYDGDRAGQAATYRASKMAIELGCKVEIVSNKTGHDPDEIIKEFGLEKLQAMVKKPITWIEFVFDYLSTKYDLDNYSSKKEFAQEVMSEIKLLSDDFDRQNFTHQLSTMTGFNFQSMLNETQVSKQKEIVQTKRVQPIAQTIDGRNKAEDILVLQMLLSIDAAEIYKEKLGFLTGEKQQKVAMMILDEYRKTDLIVLADFMDSLRSDELKKYLIDLTTLEAIPQSYEKEIVIGAIDRIKKWLLEEKVQNLKTQIKTIVNEESKIALMQEYSNSLVELRRYIDEESRKKQNSST